VDQAAGSFVLQQDASDLRAVPVRDHDLPPGLGDVGDDLRREPGRTPHALDGVLVTLLQQRVAAEGDDDAMALHGVNANPPSGAGRPVTGPG